MINILIPIFAIFCFFYYHKCLISSYKIENDKLIFYPNNFKSGYVATQEQINQTKKALKKIFYANYIGYRKDLEKIFSTSEKYESPLDRKIFRENLARATSWFEIFFFLFLEIGFIVLKISDIFFVTIIILCALIFINNIVLVKVRQIEKIKVEHEN